MANQPWAFFSFPKVRYLRPIRSPIPALTDRLALLWSWVLSTLKPLPFPLNQRAQVPFHNILLTSSPSINVQAHLAQPITATITLHRHQLRPSLILRLQRQPEPLLGFQYTSIVPARRLACMFQFRNLPRRVKRAAPVPNVLQSQFIQPWFAPPKFQNRPQSHERFAKTYSRRLCVRCL